VSDTIPETTFEQPNFGETPSNQEPLELLDGSVLPQAGEILEVATVQGEMICLARSVGGELVAFQSNCPHRGVPLCHGILERELVICLEHFWRWQVHNGVPAGGAQVALHSYRIYHQGNRVLLFPQITRLKTVQHKSALIFTYPRARFESCYSLGC
jgi:nitrite reductase/ring-hydroxylating ferredoxin subunit